MNPEEFLTHHGNNKTGVSAWLRALPFNDPTPLPENFGDTNAVKRGRVNSAAQSMKIRVNIRTIEGALWVMKPEKESN